MKLACCFGGMLAVWFAGMAATMTFFSRGTGTPDAPHTGQPDKTAEATRERAFEDYEERIAAGDYEGACVVADSLAGHYPESMRATTRVSLQYHVRMAQKDYAKAGVLAGQLVDALAGDAQPMRIRAELLYLLPVLRGKGDHDAVIALVDKIPANPALSRKTRMEYFFDGKLDAIAKKSGEDAARVALKNFVQENAGEPDALAGAAWQLVRPANSPRNRETPSGRTPERLPPAHLETRQTFSVSIETYEQAEEWAKASLALRANARAHVALAAVARWRGDKTAFKDAIQKASESADAEERLVVYADLQWLLGKERTTPAPGR